MPRHVVWFSCGAASITKPTQEECQRELDALFARYHPLGYGTKIVSYGQNAEGHFNAIITRWSSCD